MSPEAYVLCRGGRFGPFESYHIIIDKRVWLGVLNKEESEITLKSFVVNG